MSSLACTLALLVAQSMGGIGTAHPMEVTVQDDALFLHQSPGLVTRTARRLAALGADRVRITAGWSALEPKKGDFNDVALRSLDTAVKSATTAGMRVQIDLGFWAPRWAVAKRLRKSTRQRWRPNAIEFGKFADAVAKRYDGNYADPTSKKGKPLPAVRMWTTWNEPNHPSFLLPQSERTRRGWRDVAPHVYRAMHEAAYNSLKRIDQQNQVLIGGLSSRGASRPGATRNIPPLRFLRELACVNARLEPLGDPACRDYHPLQADGFAYHPYSFEAAPDIPYGGPDTVHLADLGRLTELLKQLHDRGRITTQPPLYLTEFGYESSPPDRGRRGVPPETQARYMAQGAFLAWRNPDTRMFAQFLFQDMADPRSYQTGLLFPDGRSKPALQAFKLPFWAQAQESNGQTYVIAWGQVRPDRGPQSVALEVQRPDGSWHTIPSIQAGPNPSRNCPVQDEQFLTDENGFYLRILPYQGVLAYRARWMRSDGGIDYAPPITIGVPAPA
jgi:hypothetical protein